MGDYEDIKDEKRLLREPLVAYGSQNYFELATQSIAKDKIKHVIKYTRLSLPEMIEIIPISIDTYKRKQSFGPHVTEKVLEIEEVYKNGLKAFGAGFIDWMDTINPSLGSIKPKKLLANSFGIRRLLNEIGRMEYGILA